MPKTAILIFRDENGDVPLVEWLESLEKRKPKIHKKCIAYILLLADEGYALQRPIAAPLRNGICELRPKNGHVNYRILYFWHGKDVVVLTHGLTKECEVPAADIDYAVRCKKLVESNSKKFTADFESD